MSSVPVRAGVVLLVLASACAHEPQPASPPAAALDVPPIAKVDASAPPADAAPAAPAPTASAAPAARSCTDALPPDDMLVGNFASTSVSAIGVITAATKTGPDGKGPPPSTGYVGFRYLVRVDRWLAGTGPDQIVLHQRAEADFDPRPPGTVLVFSACTTSPGNGYEPDVGYFFPVHPECRAEAESRALGAAKRVRGSALAAKKAGSACKR